MARNNGKGFGGKVLNFIGLVDDEDPRDTYGDEYESGNYGQRQAYKPQTRQSRQERPRQELVSRTSRYEPTRAPRMDRNANRSTGYESRYGSARDARGSSRTSSRGNSYIEREDSRSSGRYDYSPRSSRFGGAPSRFDDQQDGGNLPQTRQSRQGGAGGRQKTVMYNLYSLADCKEVIDQLILNATVIITMGDLEHGHLQRAVDTLSGAVFALNAKIRKVSENTYLIAPKSVDVDDAFDSDRDY